MTRKLRICPESELTPGHIAMAYYGENLSAAACKVGDKIMAFDNRCPHRSALLSQGTLTGNVVECRWHNFRFNVETGEGVTNPFACLTLFPVAVVDGFIEVDLPDA
jgi:nitrite reductase/ring-hydroxylating ferredoxin subunit